MKHLIKTLPLACILLTLACSHPVSQPREQYLQSLLDRKEYFTLRKELARQPDEISPEKQLYLGAFVDNAFNRNIASSAKIADLLDHYSSRLSDTAKAGLLQIQEDNCLKTGQYARAAAADSELLRNYRHAMDSAGFADVQNNSLIAHALSGVAPQQTTITANAAFPWIRNKIGLMEIPVRYKDSTWSCIFDTRADISSISASYAQKLGLKMLNVSYKEGSGATGNSFQSSLGIADSLWLGPILLQQVVFQVMPDEVLYLPPIHFQMNVIIGYPVLASLREIHVFRNGTMTVPIHPTASTLGNLAMNGLDPIVSARIGNDTLNFEFDTGASSSDLYSNYFRKYKAGVIRHGKAMTVKVGGAGGIMPQEIYRLDSLTLGIGHQTVTLPNIDVRIKPIPNLKEFFYGNLGQDIIARFNEMILNFGDMYIDFK
jgi:hypothetical protein